MIVPHGAYIFSGAISANAFFEIASQTIDTFILIGPDHRGIGKRISIISDGYWQTPLGNTIIDNSITNDLQNSCDFNNLRTAFKLSHKGSNKQSLSTTIKDTFKTFLGIIINSSISI